MTFDTRNATYARIDALLRTHRRLVVCTVVRTQGSAPRHVGARMVVLPNGQAHGTVGGGLFESLVVKDALVALAEGDSRVKMYDFKPVGASPHAFGAICGGWAEIYFEVAALPEHLLIVGGGHCGRALARAAILLDRFRITLVDERPACTDDRGDLPDGVTLCAASEHYAELPALIDGDTYVALVTQGFVTDERALRQVIGSEARYIGMMGSRKKVRTVFDNLRSDGIPEEAIARVQAPIGLEIGFETPAEIAVSILAQIIAVKSPSRPPAARLGAGVGDEKEVVL